MHRCRAPILIVDRLACHSATRHFVQRNTHDSFTLLSPRVVKPWLLQVGLKQGPPAPHSEVLNMTEQLIEATRNMNYLH